MPEPTLRELLETEVRLRWDSHAAQHLSLAVALDKAAERIDAETDLRWGSHHDEHVALDHARDQFSDALSDRLASMNEFRAQLAQQASTFITREVIADKETAHLTMHDHTRERIAELEQWRAAVDAKFWALGIGFTILTFAINLLSRYLLPLP